MAKDSHETAHLFDEVWRRGTYSGFSQNTRGESSTPFLDAFLKEVAAVGAQSPKLLELGAGSCDHALRCAREGFPTIAVEYSGVAVDAARERMKQYPTLPLEIVQGDLFAFTSQLEPTHLTGVYANSVFHFFSSEERRTLYRAIRAALIERGVLAISCKAHGDALEKRGRVVEHAAAGPVVEGADGIRRMFVKSPEVLADEMREEGFAVRSVIHWSVLGYNVANEPGEFVGIIAQKKIK